MTLTIARLGHLGEGIADGPVFVPRTLPGELVDGEIVAGRVPMPRIVMPSSDRVSPPCPHFKSCGGCTLQHASNAFVESWKAEVVQRALSAQGIAGKIIATHVSPARSRRRATLSARRTKKGVLVGFHARASNTIIEIPDCHVLHPDLMAARAALADLTVAGASRKAEIKFKVSTSLTGVDVAAEFGKLPDGPLRMVLAAIATRHGLARLSWNGELIMQADPPMQRIGNATVVPPPGAFLQATAEGEAALTDAVWRAVEGASTVVDLFSGCGTFALPLSQRAETHAVEGDADMLAALDAGWRNAGKLRRLTTEVRDLFDRPLMADELKRYDAAVIDPPRAGAEAQMIELAASGIGRIAAVSCNPVTFARDARILTEAGFILDWIEIVDQFRWSPHVELAAAFRR